MLLSRRRILSTAELRRWLYAVQGVHPLDLQCHSRLGVKRWWLEMYCRCSPALETEEMDLVSGVAAGASWDDSSRLIRPWSPRLAGLVSCGEMQICPMRHSRRLFRLREMYVVSGHTAELDMLYCDNDAHSKPNYCALVVGMG